MDNRVLGERLNLELELVLAPDVIGITKSDEIPDVASITPLFLAAATPWLVWER